MLCRRRVSQSPEQTGKQLQQEGCDNRCILALDLGTSSFKCAPILHGELLAEPCELNYELDYKEGRITLEDPEQYIRLAFEALKHGADQARSSCVDVGCIGICSQAQTFVGVDEFGAAKTAAISWLDGRASDVADAMTLRDFRDRTGFPKPNPRMFMPKVLHDSLHSEILKSCHRVLLLNEFVIMRLTGEAYGDKTLQGMGGFYDISRNKWNDAYIKLSGIEKGQLSRTYPAAGVSKPLTSNYGAELRVPTVPVFSCGNDQCCASIGAGVVEPGDVGCNFGTAMVVYTVQAVRPTRLKEDQIAGIDPLSGGYFLLGLESDCGNRVDHAFQRQLKYRSIDQMIRNRESTEVRTLLEHLSERFWRLLSDLVASPRNVRLIASGGLSRSDAWIHYLEQAHNICFETASHEHSTLLGIARVIERQWNSTNGA